MAEAVACSVAEVVREELVGERYSAGMKDLGAGNESDRHKAKLSKIEVLHGISNLNELASETANIDSI